jgi:hypothetical protein
VRLLAVDDASETALLTFDEHAAVDHDLDEEARLALGEPESGDRLCPLSG